MIAVLGVEGELGAGMMWISLAAKERGASGPNAAKRR